MSAVQTNLSMSPGDRDLMRMVAEIKGWSLKTTLVRGLHALVKSDPELEALRMRLPATPSAPPAVEQSHAA